MRLGSLCAAILATLLSLTPLVQGFTCGFESRALGGTCDSVSQSTRTLTDLCKNCVNCGNEDNTHTYVQPASQPANTLTRRTWGGSLKSKISLTYGYKQQCLRL
ncbi:uncharacterized protein J3D65DRAFT_619265 [Phyllosticta citribraziliensis]|uniref:Uncharacterized protein n=1 Tax=Phyllosticta citribraziliensis TaxID=989973 RepID=A0ABR1LYK2_9PEZI